MSLTLIPYSWWMFGEWKLLVQTPDRQKKLEDTFFVCVGALGSIILSITNMFKMMFCLMQQL